MTLALATRGYLQRVVSSVELFVGDGPTVSSTKVLSPEIKEATGPEPSEEDIVPVISEAETLSPEIKGATGEDPITPIIISAEET